MSNDTPPLDRFTFSLAAGKTAGKDLSLRTKAMEERIEAIVRRVDIKGVPVLRHILSLTHDQEELLLLSRALSRVAELLPELDELVKRSAIVETALEDPHWMAAVFADFSDEVDNLSGSDFME